MNQTRWARLPNAIRMRTWLESQLGLTSRQAPRPVLGLTAAVVVGAATLVVAPAISGHLLSQGDLLGSLDDRHAQILLLVVAPALWTGFLWQPLALSRIRSAFGSSPTEAHHKATPQIVDRLLMVGAVAAALSVVAFDLSHVLPNSGAWWGNAGVLSIALRELSLGLAIFVMITLVQRHARALWLWRGLAGRPSGLHSSTVAAALNRYGLVSAALLAAAGSRLVIEAIELPTRAGSITPDYHLKTALYIAAAFVLVIVPFSWLPRRLDPQAASYLRYALLPGTISLAPPAVGLLLALTAA